MLTLKEGKIIDQWSTLMEECQGEGEGLLQTVESNLDRGAAGARRGDSKHLVGDVCGGVIVGGTAEVLG